MKIKSTKEAKEYLENIAGELQSLAEIDRMEMYRMLTRIGDDMPPISNEEQTEDNFVQGCISNVYVGHSIVDGRIIFRGKSDGVIVRGYLSILVHALSGLRINDLLSYSENLIKDFCEQTDMKAYLTPSRANAFGNIYRLMRKKAAE